MDKVDLFGRIFFVVFLSLCGYGLYMINDMRECHDIIYVRPSHKVPLEKGWYVKLRHS